MPDPTDALAVSSPAPSPARGRALLRAAVGAAVLGRPALALAAEDGLIQLAVHLAINRQMAYPYHLNISG